MDENVLKKEFGKKDVTRLRNLMTGKHNEKNGQSIGYNKKQTFYKEGDVWEQDGRKWTIKDGIRQNVTKMDRAKKAYLKPLMCPKCEKIMNKGVDKGYYNQFGTCFKCFKLFETHLRVAGLYEEFLEKANNNNIDGFIKWYKGYVHEQIDQTNAGFVAENGDVESWNGGVDKAKALKALDESIKVFEEAKK
jgi:hypothetical protein|tara:strand:- start:198 stop:770 length:573 start_codon:yes stop_codon:yes gene_type:complete